MEKLTNIDVENYLKNGNLTQPFLDNDYIKEILKLDIESRLQKGKNASVLDSLMRFISKNTSYSREKSIQNQKFSRTAEEIWNSKFVSGCTDTGLLFATFSRQLGIPTTILHTAQFEWLKKLQNNEDYSIHSGHTFCECFFEDEWILIDPTAGKIMPTYDPEKIVLDYQLGESNTFIPYFRGLDMEKKMTTQEHNRIMDEECSKL